MNEAQNAGNPFGLPSILTKCSGNLPVIHRGRLLLRCLSEVTDVLAKNQVIELTITGMTAEGSGVGHSEDGMAVFVPFTAVGDTLECRIVKVNARHAFGKVERILTTSEHRLKTVDCPVFGKCGGCVYRHVSYEAELQYKWQRVADAITRIGGISLTPRPIVGCASPDRYRNKGQYPVAAGEHRPLIGLYAARSHRVVEQHDCLLQPEGFATILKVVGKWAKASGVSLYDETAKRGVLRHIYIRRGARSGEVMVCLVCTTGKLPQTDRLIEALKAAVPGLASVLVNLNKADTNVILGDTCYPLYGNGYITDRLCGLNFRLSPLSFYQVNTEQAEVLYTLAKEAAGLTGRETVLDLYCGTGTIGLSMAKEMKQLIGVEIVPEAVEDARLNARENGIENARFLAADASRAARQLEWEGIAPDVVILDPPRKGCDEEVIQTVARMAPERVVYVSCDPATLARDIHRFAEMGYVTSHITPVDMFPRTAHVECVALLVRHSDINS